MPSLATQCLRICVAVRCRPSGAVSSLSYRFEVVPADRLEYCNMWQPVPFQFFVALLIRRFNFWGWSYPRKLNHLKNFHVYGITCAASSSITIIMWSAVVGCYIVWLPCFIAFKLTRSIILMHTSIRIVVCCMYAQLHAIFHYKSAAVVWLVLYAFLQLQTEWVVNHQAACFWPLSSHPMTR